MDRQAIYNKVRAHLLSMDAPAGVTDRSSFRCRYLDDEGRKCAIGIFIPDGHPGQDCEGDLVVLLGDYPDLIPAVGLTLSNFDYDDDEDVEFLCDLQAVHDQVRLEDDDQTPLTHWGPGGLNEIGREALDDVAYKHGVNIEGG